MLKPVPLFGIGNTAVSPNVSAQDRLNLYVEVNADAEKHVLTMYPTPGLVTFVNFGSNPIRCLHQFGNALYLVVRDSLIRVLPDGTIASIGTLNTTEGRIDVADNGTQIMFVDNPNGYIYNTATLAFAEITDTDFPGAVTVTFLNGRFVITEPNSGRFWCSASYDGLAWDALDFATAESDPDDVSRVIAEGGSLYLLGDKTLEVWGDSGAQDFPYARVSGGAIDWGLAARWSLVKYADSLAFLRKNRLGQVQACVMSGGNAVPISTPAIEAIFGTYGDVSNATGLAYMLQGHAFYQLNFPSVGVSWLFDGQSRSWSRLQSGTSGRHRANISAQLQNVIYACDFENGKLYRIGANVFTDDGLVIPREFTSRHVSDGEELTISQVWLEMESGTGTQLGQGRCPQIMMQVSKDGGHTWGNELWRDLGAAGQYQTRAVWNRLGRSRDWLFRFRVTDPVKTVFVAAYGRITR